LETKGPGKTHTRLQRKKEAKLCPSLNPLKKQNQQKNICRLILPALEQRTNFPSTSFTIRTTWRRLVLKQQRCPLGTCSEELKGFNEQKWSHTVLQVGTKALSGGSCELPWSALTPSSPGTRVTPTAACKALTQACMATSKRPIRNSNPIGKIYWDPETAHRGHSKLHLQPC
jgi:hypothetical protein